MEKQKKKNNQPSISRRPPLKALDKMLLSFSSCFYFKLKGCRRLFLLKSLVGLKKNHVPLWRERLEVGMLPFGFCSAVQGMLTKSYLFLLKCSVPLSWLTDEGMNPPTQSTATIFLPRHKPLSSFCSTNEPSPPLPILHPPSSSLYWPG